MANIFKIEGCEIPGWNGLYKVNGERNGKDLYCHVADAKKEIFFCQGGNMPFGWVMQERKIEFYIMQREGRGEGHEPTKLPPASGWDNNDTDVASALRIVLQHY